MPDSNLTRVGNRERIEAHRRAFASTIEAYKEIQHRHPLAAMNLDTEAQRSRALGPRVIEFKADCEAACRFALRNNPELHETLETIVNEEPNDPKLAFKVEQLCGKHFVVRHITPVKYFAPRIRTGRVPDRRAA